MRLPEVWQGRCPVVASTRRRDGPAEGARCSAGSRGGGWSRSELRDQGVRPDRAGAGDQRSFTGDDATIRPDHLEVRCEPRARSRQPRHLATRSVRHLQPRDARVGRRSVQADLGRGSAAGAQARRNGGQPLLARSERPGRRARDRWRRAGHQATEGNDDREPLAGAGSRSRSCRDGHGPNLRASADPVNGTNRDACQARRAAGGAAARSRRYFALSALPLARSNSSNAIVVCQLRIVIDPYAGDPTILPRRLFVRSELRRWE